MLATLFVMGLTLGVWYFALVGLKSKLFPCPECKHRREARKNPQRGDVYGGVIYPENDDGPVKLLTFKDE